MENVVQLDLPSIVVAPGDLYALACSFPTLERTPRAFFETSGSGTRFKWSREHGAEAFAAWANKGGSGQRDAALFVLGVWNHGTDWRPMLENRHSGRFDVFGALGNWDDKHRAAFLQWAAQPWWM